MSVIRLFIALFIFSFIIFYILIFSFFFFFLLIPRPPRSTLLPYTTLFRSVARLLEAVPPRPREGCFRSSYTAKEERTIDHAHVAASLIAGHPCRNGRRSTESITGTGQAFGRRRQAWRPCHGLLPRSYHASLPIIQRRRRNRRHGQRPER